MSRMPLETYEENWPESDLETFDPETWIELNDEDGSLYHDADYEGTTYRENYEQHSCG